MEFTIKALCSLRYGDTFLSCSVDLGNEFYLKSNEDLYNKYALAKANGASESELDSINEQIIQVEHKNNPLQMQRMFILKHLEPYRHLSVNEVLNLYDKGLADEETVRIKINFTSLIDRFERENLNITEFGINVDFATKIETIKDIIYKYGSENRSTSNSGDTGGLPAEGGGGEPVPSTVEPSQPI